MKELDQLPKIDPAEVEILIEKFEQNNLGEEEKRLITGLLRTLLVVVTMLQEKKATLLRLRDILFLMYLGWAIPLSSWKSNTSGPIMGRIHVDVVKVQFVI